MRARMIAGTTGGTNGKLVEFATRAAEAEIQELKRQLAEETHAARQFSEAVVSMDHRISRLSQVNGKLVMALRVIVSSCLHHPEIHLTLKLALANAESVLAEAQKENK